MKLFESNENTQAVKRATEQHRDAIALREGCRRMTVALLKVPHFV